MEREEDTLIDLSWRRGHSHRPDARSGWEDETTTYRFSKAELEATKGMPMPRTSDADDTTERDIQSARYEVLDRIGRGGAAEVFRARDKFLVGDRRRAIVALKVLGASSSLGHCKERMKDEVYVGRQIVSPNVAQIYDLTRLQDDRWAIAQELIEGRTLRDLMKGGFEADWLRIARIGVDVASGLHAAHLVGAVHRDLKSDNIMVRDVDDSAVVLDFGLAKLLGAQSVGLTDEGSVVGTILYMAPEQIRNQTDPRSDLYALGLTLVELAAGRVPRASDATLQGIIHERVSAPKPFRFLDWAPRAPVEFAAVVDRLLETHPRDRFQTGADVADALRSFLERSTAPTVPTPVIELGPAEAAVEIADGPPEVAGPPGSRSTPLRTASGWVLFAATLMLLLGIVFAGIASVRGAEPRGLACSLRRRRRVLGLP